MQVKDQNCLESEEWEHRKDHVLVKQSGRAAD